MTNINGNTWAILWRPHQRCLHTERVDQMLTKNVEIFLTQQAGD